MSTTEEQAQGQAAGTEELEVVSLLEQAISATKQTERDRSEDLLKNLAAEAMKGTITWNRNLTVTFNEAIAKLDDLLSRQLAAVMHHEKFQKLEGSWRGLNHLVMNSETGANLKIKMFNVSKRDLFKDLDKAVEFDQSQVFKKLYENEFGTPGGEPYGALIGDYEFT
ncbi:MAG: type VI secretion system contractile sheath large subunit, partial [Gammaproteobacteria bacterium]|nr:type VI secretion system contractile sheath large subunit [Gammaproteobacteria bacterium]